MPRRLPSAPNHRRRTPRPPQWIVAETLGGAAHSTVIADGAYRRRFANLARVSIARTASLVRSLPAVVEQCAASGEPQVRLVQLPNARTIRLGAVPVQGPRGGVYAVLVWAGAGSCGPPQRPSIGTLEWNACTGIAKASALTERMLGIAHTGGHREWTLADLMCRFEWWEDRAGFLALFDRSEPAGEWTGSATIVSFGDRCQRHMYVAARRCSTAAGHVVRAIVHDVTGSEPLPRCDSHAIALRRIPTQEGHAIGLTDVGSWLVHDWIAIDDTPLRRWRHRSPEVHVSDLESIARCRAALLAGAESIGCRVRIRFSENDRWDTVWAEWTILSRSDRPQAVFDITWDLR
ncbi:GAF domain-containing protein [Nocardia colli]|uniref:GAF domain-containing protein n=1 Tax=Nocardia colli TaxID=2545717 RepID=UPI0035DD08EC